MKALKKTFLILITLVIIFFAVGILNPSISYDYEITVNKPAKETWAVAKDESKFDQWLEGFISIELIEGELEKPGSKYKVVLQSEDQPPVEIIETLLSINEFEQIKFNYDNEYMNMDYTITHSEVEGTTIVKTESKVMAKSLIMRSMFTIMETFGGVFYAQEKKNMVALKRVIDENTTDYYPAPINQEIDPELLEQ